MKLLQQNHVKYGLVMALVLALCLVTVELTGQTLDEKSPFSLIIMFLAPLIIWTLGIKKRKEAQGGKLTYKEGINEGLKIALVYGIVSPFVFLIYYLNNPAPIEYARTAYGLTGASDVTVVIVDMIAQFVISIIFGLIYSAVISLFLKTKS